MNNEFDEFFNDGYDDYEDEDYEDEIEYVPMNLAVSEAEPQIVEEPEDEGYDFFGIEGEENYLDQKRAEERAAREAYNREMVFITAAIIYCEEHDL